MMKRILIIVFLLVLNFTLKAQILQQPNTYGIGWKRTGADTLIYIPSDTLSVPSWGVGKTHIARKGTTLYYWDGSKWSAISGGGGVGTYTAGNGLTLSGSQFKLGGTIVGEETSIVTDSPLDITYTNGNDYGQISLNGQEPTLSSTNLGSLISSGIIIKPDIIKIQPAAGGLKIDTLLYTLSTTGKKIMLRDTATGLVQNIDPASLVTPGGSTKQFQYNNAGVLAGSGMLSQETDQILIIGNSDASTPPFRVEGHENLTAEIVNVTQSGAKKFSFHSNGSIEMQEVSAPATPASNYVSVWANSGNSKLYLSNDAAEQKQLITQVIPVFGAGSGADSDTTAFTTSAIYGSFYNDADTIVVTSMRAVLQGTSPDVTYKVWYNDSLNVEAGATALVTAGSQVTNTTTGTNVTSFDVTKIPPGVWVWVKTSTVAVKPKYFSLTINGYRK